MMGWGWTQQPKDSFSCFFILSGYGASQRARYPTTTTNCPTLQTKWFLKPLNTATLIHFISPKSHFSTTVHRIQIWTGAHQGSQKISFELHLISLFFSWMLPQHIPERSSEFAKGQQFVLVCVCCTGALKCLLTLISQEKQ